MSGLEQKLSADVKEALKAGDAPRTSALRLLLAALRNRSIEKRGSGSAEELSDAEGSEVLRGELKKRREAAALYKKGGREDLAAAEEQEAAVVKRYLPAMLGPEELGNAVRAALERSGAKEFPQAMKSVMASLKGKAEGSDIAEAVRKELARMHS